MSLRGSRLLTLAYLASLTALAHASTDWSTPCFANCSYDISNDHISATLYIAGNHSSVSDITPAAGWSILNCGTNGTIAAECNSSDSACEHVFQGGAVGTIVRLPENCTDMAFARVAAAWNETVPSKRSSRLFGRQATSVIHGFDLDTNFSAIDVSQHGGVMFCVQSANMPTSSMNKRSLLGSIGQDIGQAIGNATTISKNLTGTAPPVSVNQNAVLFNESIACPKVGNIPPFTADVVVSMDAAASANLNYGVAVSGTIVPPALNEFQLYAGLDGTINGTLTVNASASTTLSTGLIPVFSVPIGPGIDIPGILTIGPTFSVNVEGTAALDVGLNMVVGLNYTISDAELYFPPMSNTSSGGVFQPGDTALQLAATPNVTSDTTLTAHLIPEISFGINALSGVAQATVDLQLDASLSLTLDLAATGTGVTSTNMTTSTSNTTASASDGAFGGSVSVQAALDASAGANAAFLSFFNDATTVPLFDKTFELFQESFGNAAAKRRRMRRRRVMRRDTLTCPVYAEEALESIAMIEKAGAALDAAD